MHDVKVITIRSTYKWNIHSCYCLVLGLSIKMICRLYSLIIFVGGLLGQENVDQGGGFLTKADKFYQQQENIFQIVDDNYISRIFMICVFFHDIAIDIMTFEP